MSRWTPNRIVALGGGVLALVAGVVGAAAGVAGPGAATLLGGIAGGAVLGREWLVGWREHEARQGEANQPVGWDDAEEILGRMHPEAVKALTERLRAGTPPRA